MIIDYLPRFNAGISEKKVIHRNNSSKQVDSLIKDGLGERQKLVYETLKYYANGATAKELSVYLFNQGKVASHERNSVHPRLNELIKEGFVKVIGKKTCQYTDRKVSIYKIVD